MQSTRVSWLHSWSSPEGFKCIQTRSDYSYSSPVVFSFALYSLTMVQRPPRQWPAPMPAFLWACTLLWPLYPDSTQLLSCDHRWLTLLALLMALSLFANHSVLRSTATFPRMPYTFVLLLIFFITFITNWHRKRFCPLTIHLPYWTYGLKLMFIHAHIIYTQTCYSNNNNKIWKQNSIPKPLSETWWKSSGHMKLKITLGRVAYPGCPLILNWLFWPVFLKPSYSSFTKMGSSLKKMLLLT